jgi:predicted DNA-binding protein (UPF0251 family)
MGRCKKRRCCRLLSNERLYKPIAVPMNDISIIEIGYDEFEAMRLCDTEDNSQIEASEKMKISRGTIQRLLGNGRKKIILAILQNKAIKINNK